MNTESPDWIDAWHDLYVMLGTSSAALLGLLYIDQSGFAHRQHSNRGHYCALMFAAPITLRLLGVVGDDLAENRQVSPVPPPISRALSFRSL
jgi:hypothetical protein